MFILINNNNYFLKIYNISIAIIKSYIELKTLYKIFLNIKNIKIIFFLINKLNIILSFLNQSFSSSCLIFSFNC